MRQWLCLFSHACTSRILQALPVTECATFSRPANTACFHSCSASLLSTPRVPSLSLRFPFHDPRLVAADLVYCRCFLIVSAIHSHIARSRQRPVVINFLQFLGRVRAGRRGVDCESILSGNFNVQLLRERAVLQQTAGCKVHRQAVQASQEHGRHRGLSRHSCGATAAINFID